MNREDGFFPSQAWKPLIRDLKEWRQSHDEVSALYCGLSRRFSSCVLHSLCCHHLPTTLLMPAWSSVIGVAQFLLHSSPLALSFKSPLPHNPIYIYRHTHTHTHGLSQSRLITSAFKMETACFFEVLASTNQSTWWLLNPEECYQIRHSHENLNLTSDIV
jgi:hypothetical protein